MINRRSGLLVAQTLLGLGLLGAWLWFVDLKAVGVVLSQANWVLVVVAAGFGVTSTVIRVARWRIILLPVARIPFLDLWLISLASSLINFVLPIRSGEVAKGLFLKQRHNVSIAASLPTVAVDRSFDMLALLTIGAVGILTGLRFQTSLTVVFVIGAGLFFGFVTFVILAIFWHERLMQVAKWAVPRFIGENLRNRMLGILSGILVGFTTIGRQPRNLVPITAMSYIAALLDAGLFFLLFLSVGNPVSPIVALTGYAIFAITFLVPGGPGYIGSMEAFGSLVFGGALGIPQAAAASVVLIFHALNALILGIFGGVAFWALGIRPTLSFGSSEGDLDDIQPTISAHPGSG